MHHVSIVRCSSSISEMIISEIMEISRNPKMGVQNGYPKWVTYVTHLCILITRVLIGKTREIHI